MKWLAAILLLGGFLRLFDLGILPNGLHWDEQDTGYQAYSLLLTGRDYFGNLFPLFPHSFADYRTPVFIYSAVPFVASLGLSAVSVRMVAAVWGLLGITSIYVLARLMFRPLGRDKLLGANIGHISALLLALSHWHLQYSRKSVETISLNTLFIVGLAAFFRSFDRPRWLIVSGLLLGLATAAYSPGKLFVPLLVLALLVIYRRRLMVYPAKILLVSSLVFGLITGSVYLDGLFGSSGTRFHDISVFSDPTIPTEVDYARLQAALSSGVPKRVGLSPRLIDRIQHNKIQEWLVRIANNYLSTWSTDFLFIRGDQEPRHSPSRDRIGQLHLTEMIPLILGLYFLFSGSVSRSTSRVMGAWLLLAPIPSALTRDGGTHAARLLVLLPGLVLTIALGLFYLKRLPAALYSYLALFSLSVVLVYSYYFSHYRFESAAPYQWGFGSMVRAASLSAADHDLVVVDFYRDDPLMAYLFTAKIPPREFQKLQPFPAVEHYPGLTGRRFGNLLLLTPGSRAWEDIRKGRWLSGKNLVYTIATQPSVRPGMALETFEYPDSTPAFYKISP